MSLNQGGEPKITQAPDGKRFPCGWLKYGNKPFDLRLVKRCGAKLRRRCTHSSSRSRFGGREKSQFWPYHIRNVRPVSSLKRIRTALPSQKRGTRMTINAAHHPTRTSSLLNNLVFLVFRYRNSGFLTAAWALQVARDTLRDRKEYPPSCSGHQVSQSTQVVSSSGEGKQPPDLLDPSQLHFL